MLKTWSSTQPTVSLSSGEAEFYGVVKAAGLALGQQSVLRDLGKELPVRVWTDSTAAIGICSRQGLGKLRHIATHTLWVQEKVRSKAIELRKVHGEVNPADLFTKHLLGRERVEMLVDLFGCQYRAGRAESAPKLRRKELEVNAVGESIVGGRPQLVGEQGRMHDPAILPHHHPRDVLDDLFPAATAPDEPFDSEEVFDDWRLAEPMKTAIVKRADADKIRRRSRI